MNAEPVNLPPRETIFIADDEPLVLDLCKTVLSLGGYNILSARGGEEAVAFFEQGSGEEVHVALLDIMMPDLNGFEVGRRIQRANPRTKVVLMSGYHPAEVAKITGRDSDFAIIWKPFRAESLLRMIENVLKLPIAEPAVAKSA